MRRCRYRACLRTFAPQRSPASRRRFRRGFYRLLAGFLLCGRNFLDSRGRTTHVLRFGYAQHRHCTDDGRDVRAHRKDDQRHFRFARPLGGISSFIWSRRRRPTRTRTDGRRLSSRLRVRIGSRQRFTACRAKRRAVLVFGSALRTEHASSSFFPTPAMCTPRLNASKLHPLMNRAAIRSRLLQRLHTYWTEAITSISTRAPAGIAAT